MRVRYDRGTLVVEDVPTGLDAGVLPGVAWDARVGAHRVPAHRWQELRAALAASGVDSVDGPPPPEPTPGTWSTLELRPHQQAALAAWQRASMRGIVALPTGSGKTHVALAAIATTRLPTLCIVPTRALLFQWQVALSRVTSCPIGCYGDGERTLAPITLATIESAWRHADVLGDRFGLVIVDEVHDMGNGVRDEALEMNLAGARLGLTATPARGESQLARLRELVGPVICEMAVRELTGGVLAPLRAMVLTLDLNAEERRRYDELMGLFRAEAAQWRELVDLGAWSDLTRALAQTEDGRKALTAWRQARKLIAFTDSKSVVLGALLACHRDSRTLVFTADNDSAYAVAREHLVMPITCDIGRAERADALAAFERGDLRALVSARVLNEGIDVPAADVAVVVSAGLGEREHVQRVGRLLRPHPGKTAVVYELVARGTFEVAQSRRRRKGIAA